MFLLFLLFASPALAHGGRTIDGEQDLILQVTLGLGLLLTGWGMVHFSSRAIRLPAHLIKTRGRIPLTLAVVSTLLFAVLCWVSVKPAGTLLPVLLETAGKWEVHHPGGLHSESTLLLEEGKPVKLQIEAASATRFQVSGLGVDVPLQKESKTVVGVKAPRAGLHETNVEGLMVQVLPKQEFDLLTGERP